MTELTPGHLRDIMPNIPQRDEVTEFPACCNAMRRFHITDKKRAAAWLGNVAKESGELFYVEEIASGAAYEGRLDLGNIHPGDGVRFKGRGYIQITGRTNYTKIAQAFDIPCVANPDILEKMPWRWLTAGHNWEHMSSLGNLNLIADQGDFERTVLGVRGGADPERRVYYDRAMRILPDDLTIPAPGPAPAPDPEQKAVVLKVGLGKDGNSSVGYVRDHPTNYIWRADIERLTARLVNMDDFYEKIWINTYKGHPPGWNRDTTSFDVWGFGGRGATLPEVPGREVFDVIFGDPNPPDIWWTIYQGRMWTRAGGWGPSPPGPPDSDPEHNLHIHVTYLDDLG
ncbi:MAG: glycoside hydrolase family 19 protein [Rubrobacter sp.]